MHITICMIRLHKSWCLYDISYVIYVYALAVWNIWMHTTATKWKASPSECYGIMVFWIIPLFSTQLLVSRFWAQTDKPFQKMMSWNNTLMVLVLNLFMVWMTYFMVCSPNMQKFRNTIKNHSISDYDHHWMITNHHLMKYLITYFVNE